MSFEMPPDPGAPRPNVMPARRRNKALLPTVVIVAALLAIFGIFTGFYTNFLWFRSIGYTTVWRVELTTKALLFLVFGLAMALAVAVNAVVAHRTRPAYQPLSPEQQNLDRYRTSIEPYRKLLVLGGAAFLGLLAGSSAAGQWRTFLLWRNSVPFEGTDPQFDMNIGFYAFSLPWWRFLVGFGFALVVISLLVAVGTHYLYGGLRLQSGGDRTTPGTRVHLSVLIGLFVLLKAVAYWLDRYSLAVKDGQVGQSDFVGLTFTDVNAVLYSKLILTFISIICAALFFANIVRRTWLLPGLGVGLLLLVAVLVGGVYPAIVQALQVRPSEPQREAPYIERNIDATRDAYDIDDAEVTDYQATTEVSAEELRNDADLVPSVRLLDPAVVSPTYQALQQIRDFYAFPDTLDVDRYDIDGVERDAVVSVREIDISRIPADRRNWNNDHLINTHGFGFVAARGNARQSDGQPSFVVSDIPPRGELGDFEPRIYYGERSPAYSIVGAPPGSEPRELDFPDDTSDTGQQNFTYDGEGGVPVGSFFNQLLFAVNFQDQNILLSSGVNEESKVLYIRSPRERVEKVAPWLQLDGNPYPALVDGRILWIIDGYTTSNGYPYAQRTTLESATSDSITQTRGAVVAQPQERVNYIRNSVKATVDAYDGTVTLYEWDEQDPMLQAWMKAFPDTVEARADIPTALLAHLRYPSDLFKVQRTLLAEYHVTDPTAFYTGSDFWRVPGDPTEQVPEGTPQPSQPPYYLTLRMPGDPEPVFSLTSTFVPRGRPQLSAFAAVNSDPESPDYGKIRVLQLPRNTPVPGPGLVQNNFEANPEVASALALLRRGESEVELGNLLTLPVGGGLLYVEPVYVRAAGGDASYPLLQRVLVAFGDDIAFEETLPEALDSLFEVAAGDEPSTPDPEAPEPEPGATPNPPPTDGEEPPPAEDPDLASALADADAALADAQLALENGDFAAYGEAQERLREAIDRALAAQEAGDGALPEVPEPAPGNTPAVEPDV